MSMVWMLNILGVEWLLSFVDDKDNSRSSNGDLLSTENTGPGKSCLEWLRSLVSQQETQRWAPCEEGMCSGFQQGRVSWGRIRGEGHHSVFKSSATEKRSISGEMHLLAQIMETGRGFSTLVGGGNWIVPCYVLFLPLWRRLNDKASPAFLFASEFARHECLMSYYLLLDTNIQEQFSAWVPELSTSLPWGVLLLFFFLLLLFFFWSRLLWPFGVFGGSIQILGLF